jgi:hypothetical protein
MEHSVMPRDTRHLVDPELIPALDPYPSVGLPIASLAAEARTTLAAARDSREALRRAMFG